MEFRIADSFTDSLARLTGEEQKAVKTTAFDLQLNPASPGMQFHKLDKAKDKKAQGIITCSDLFNQLAAKLPENKHQPFDFAVVDEAQDVSIPQLRFLAALAAGRPNSLFFAGDLGQRIFQQPFSWKALGIDIRGRSKTLRINYRTAHQIRLQADRLLAPELSDVDGNTEERRGTISIFNGPQPAIMTLNTQEEERRAVGGWLCLSGRL